MTRRIGQGAVFCPPASAFQARDSSSTSFTLVIVVMGSREKCPSGVFQTLALANRLKRGVCLQMLFRRKPPGTRFRTGGTARFRINAAMGTVIRGPVVGSL